MAVLECTISGIDSGGFAWSNVFHLQADVGPGSFFDLLGDTANDIMSDVLPVYQAAANDQIVFTDVGVKGVGVDASYTLHLKASLPGLRAVVPVVGALCPMIRFLPALGTIVGGLFAVGAGILDFIGDEIQAAYQSLLDDLAVKFLEYDGTVTPHNWQLITYNPNGPVITPMKHSAVPVRPTTLNKRIRG